MRMLQNAWPINGFDLEMTHVEGLKWLAPVRPDDKLGGEARLLSGTFSDDTNAMSITLQNQDRTPVLEMNIRISKVPQGVH